MNKTDFGLTTDWWSPSEVKSKAQRSFSRSLFKAKHAVLNVVTRENPPNLTNKDFTIEDWGRKITHQQEEGKGKVLIFTVRLQFATSCKQQVFDPCWPTSRRLRDLIQLVQNFKNSFKSTLMHYVHWQWRGQDCLTFFYVAIHLVGAIRINSNYQKLNRKQRLKIVSPRNPF